MADIEFDREAVGITAKRNWRDADYFAEIGSRIYYIRDIGMVALSSSVNKGDWIADDMKCYADSLKPERRFIRNRAAHSQRRDGRGAARSF